MTRGPQLTIAGAGTDATVIDASGLGDRVLSIAPGAEVKLSQLRISGGHALSGGSGVSCPAGDGGSGGAISSSGTLVLDTVAVTGNVAGVGGAGCSGGNGGGIYSTGRLSVINSTVRSNAAGDGGSGGAGGAGGGIYDDGSLTVTGSFISANRAGAGRAGGDGGGVFSSGGRLTLINSTLTENVAGAGGAGGVGGSGGAVAVRAGASTLVNDTVARNVAGAGGAGGGLFAAGGALRLKNTIVALNTGAGCAGSAIASGGRNLSYGDRTCPGRNGNPELGKPKDNGGPTETLALERGSAAINRGAGCPGKDQRGVRRPQGGACDIGAFEFAVPQISIIRPRNRGSYERGSHIRAAFRCTEGGIASPIATCKATVRRGRGINTRSVGTKRFRIIAVDKTGHRRVMTVHYNVWAYVNPLRAVSGLGPYRIDMGVDYSGSGPLLALGDAKVTFASNTDSGPPSCWGITCWPGGGAVVYRLTDGPFAGKYVYYAERVTVTVRTGQTVQAGQQVAIEHLGSPNIEVGWGSGRGPETLAIARGHQCTCGDPGGWSAIEGRNFNSLLARLGAPSGFLQPGVPSQSMPHGWPALPAGFKSRLIPRWLTPTAEGAAARVLAWGP